jgi:hypothetical protein
MWPFLHNDGIELHRTVAGCGVDGVVRLAPVMAIPNLLALDLALYSA